MRVILAIYNKTSDKHTMFMSHIPVSEGRSSDGIFNQLTNVLSNFLNLQDIVVGMPTDNISNMQDVYIVLKDSKLFGHHCLGHIGCLLCSINIMNNCFFKEPKIYDYKHKIIDGNKDKNGSYLNRKEKDIRNAIERNYANNWVRFSTKIF